MGGGRGGKALMARPLRKQLFCGIPYHRELEQRSRRSGAYLWNLALYSVIIIYSVSFWIMDADISVTNQFHLTRTSFIASRTNEDDIISNNQNRRLATRRYIWQPFSEIFMLNSDTDAKSNSLECEHKIEYCTLIYPCFFLYHHFFVLNMHLENGPIRIEV